MIISASRRTDIPTYYSDWFFNRIRDGFVCVRNPRNYHLISKILLTPELVDGIVFWTKNPVPMLGRLHELDGKYMYYFQFTVTSYDNDVETNMPSKRDVIIPTFKKLSGMIGADRFIWRYDPILLTPKYNVQYHLKYFSEIAKQLSGYTKKCIISFVDLYKTTLRNTGNLDLIHVEPYHMHQLAKVLADVAQSYNIKVESCSEKIDLEQFGIAHGHCIDCQLFEKLLGYKLKLDKDRNQREECGCVSSIDIGMYNTCKNGCKYCYASYNRSIVAKNYAMHDVNSPLISGNLLPDDVVKVLKTKSIKNYQQSIF